METVTLNNGLEMPALGLGVFQTPPDETREAVRAALGAGYRHIDTAAAYGNEREVGEAVNSSDLDRSEVFLETKIWISDYGHDETLHGFEKSARKLGVEIAKPPRLRRGMPAEYRKHSSVVTVRIFQRRACVVVAAAGKLQGGVGLTPIPQRHRETSRRTLLGGNGGAARCC